MSWATAVVIIVALCVFAEIAKAKYRAREGITKDWLGNEVAPDDPSRLPPVDAKLRDEVEMLRERVKVLERIATEDRETKRLSAEIESLREK